MNPMPPEVQAAVERLRMPGQQSVLNGPVPENGKQFWADIMATVQFALTILPSGPRPEAVKLSDGDSGWACNGIYVFPIERRGTWGHVNFSWAEQMDYDMRTNPPVTYRTEADALNARARDLFDAYVREMAEIRERLEKNHV